MNTELFKVLSTQLEAIDSKTIFAVGQSAFEFLFADNRHQIIKLPDGYTGVHITDITINDSHELITTMSDGAILTLGTIEFTKE